MFFSAFPSVLRKVLFKLSIVFAISDAPLKERQLIIKKTGSVHNLVVSDLCDPL